jgi:hypothetical protein
VLSVVTLIKLFWPAWNDRYATEAAAPKTTEAASTATAALSNQRRKHAMPMKAWMHREQALVWIATIIVALMLAAIAFETLH